MKKVLGLDISSSVIGYGIIEFDDKDIKLTKYGHIKPPSSDKGSLSFRALEASKDVRKLFLQEMPDEVVVEMYANRFAAGRTTARTIIVLSFFNELCQMVCLDSLGKESTKYTVSSIRASISKYLKYKSISKDEIFETIKKAFPNFTPRINKNGNVGAESFDQADAIAVAFCHAIVSMKNNKQEE
jgi:Holliday junction resolvasome RuvABC endonuclease subunit